MNLLKNKKLLTFFRVLPLLLCGIFILCYFIFAKDVSVEKIINYTPANPVLAALVLILMYAAKSMSVFFPVILLQLAGGRLFSTAAAVFVNLAGMAVCLTVPYWIGKTSGLHSVQGIMQKYPKFSELTKRQQSNDFFISYFLRVISCLPGDIVSMYLGSINIPFAKYLLAGMLGVSPGVIAGTLVGEIITDPGSPLFILSAMVTIILSAASFIFCSLYKHRLNRKGHQERRHTKTH